MTNTRELLKKLKDSNHKSHEVTVEIDGEATTVPVILKKVTLQDIMKFTSRVPHLYNIIGGIQEETTTPEEQMEQIVRMLEVMKALIVMGVLDPETKTSIFALEDSAEAISPDVLGIEGINALGLEVLNFSGFRS